MLNILMTLLFAMVMGGGQIVLSLASKEIFIGGAELSVRLIMTSKWLWLGVMVYAGSLMFWVYILSKFDVKYAYPISSTAIIFAAIFQSLIDKSFPSASYWIGLIFVMTGLVFISQSARP